MKNVSVLLIALIIIGIILGFIEIVYGNEQVGRIGGYLIFAPFFMVASMLFVYEIAAPLLTRRMVQLFAVFSIFVFGSALLVATFWDYGIVRKDAVLRAEMQSLVFMCITGYIILLSVIKRIPFIRKSLSVLS